MGMVLSGDVARFDGHRFRQQLISLLELNRDDILIVSVEGLQVKVYTHSFITLFFCGICIVSDHVLLTSSFSRLYTYIIGGSNH